MKRLPQPEDRATLSVYSFCPSSSYQMFTRSVARQAALDDQWRVRSPDKFGLFEEGVVFQ